MFCSYYLWNCIFIVIFGDQPNEQPMQPTRYRSRLKGNVGCDIKLTLVDWTRPPSRTRFLRPRKEVFLWNIGNSGYRVCGNVAIERRARPLLDCLDFVAGWSLMVWGSHWSLDFLPVTSVFGLGGRVEPTRVDYKSKWGWTKLNKCWRIVDYCE